MPTPPSQCAVLRARLAGGLLFATLALLHGCEKPGLPPPGHTGKLIVAVRPGPATWYPGPDNLPMGFDHDLLARFAAEQKLEIVMVDADSAVELAEKVLSGTVHMGIGGLALPAAGATMPPDAGRNAALWTVGFHPVQPAVIYQADSYRPKGWADLAGATVAYVEGTAIDAALMQLRAEHPEILWQRAPLPSADALIGAVSDGEFDYAVVPSVDAETVRNIFFNFELAFASGQKSELAWMVAPGGRALARELDAFLARVRNDGVLARYAQRYFARDRLIERVNASVFAERMKTALPQYRKLLHDAQAATGMDWRLLAAVSYQESQWDPAATSETGVRGFMQLTDETARHLGIADRLDPQASAMGAARYLQDLKTRLPGRIVEPDRTWFALAAFNIGLGHLEDARVLAQKQKRNPDLWSDVRKVLPLLALPDYYETAKNGYARGGMPVAFVDRVRAFYDILLRQEPPYTPALRVPPLAGK